MLTNFYREFENDNVFDTNDFINSPWGRGIWGGN
jgi:hypothetical protein